jgi:hypothetical protein
MPNNFPAPTEIVASDPRLLWYWNQAAAEMDRRGNLCPIDADILEMFAMLADKFAQE